MYKITAKFPDGNDLVLYDPAGTGELPILGPKQTEELNQPGSLTFSLLYPHEAYGLLEGMKTYISSEKEGTEIFYGRVLDVEPDELAGQEIITCEGALSFLNDGFLAPDPKNSSGTAQSQTMTAEAFFRRCINEFNADIGNDPRRVFTIGNVTVARKDETRLYQITQFTSAKEAIEQNLLNNYGGFLKVYRSPQGQLMIDWVEDYGVVNNGRVELGENVISQSNRLSGENLFTAIRPVGKDGLVHSTTPIIDVYPAEEMAEYGRIVKNIDFPGITNESDLLAAGQALVQRINKTIYRSSEINLLDLSFVDDEEPEVNLGNRYTNITGLEGDELTVSTRNRDYENPQNDSISLKNAKHLEGNGIDDFKNNEGGISKQSSRSSGGVGMALKYYHELQDEATIIADRVRINGQRIDIAAETLIETGNEMERLSTVAGDLGNRVTGIEGTGVIQNSDRITQVSGKFRVETLPGESTTRVILEEGAKLSVEDDGVYSDVIGADGVRSIVAQTATEIRSEISASNSTIYSSIEQTASNIRSEVGNRIDGVTSSIEQTAASIRAEVNASNSEVYSFVEQTASYIRSEVGDTVSDVYSAIEQTASSIRAEVNASNSEVYSFVEQTASYIRSEVGDTVSDVYSAIEQTASSIRAEVTASNSEVYSYVEQTASYIRSEVGNSLSDVQSSISQTAESIRSEVNASNSEIYSAIEQTASSIRSEVGDSLSGVYSSITQTAESIRSDVSASDSEIYSAIEQTASSIKSEVGNSLSGVYSSIAQTAEEIRSDVSAADSAIYSSIEQTASAIRSTIADTENGLYNYIQNTASGTRQIIVNTTNRTWIQDTDPRTAAGGSHQIKVGDIWIESTHQGTWDGAEGFNWEHDEGYDWTQIQGAKIWGWQNGKWELISDQQQVVSYSDVINTAEHYVSEKIAGLTNDEGLLDVYMSKIEQTATEIRSDISSSDSTIYSFIKQTRSNILLRVAEQPGHVYSKTQPTKIVYGEGDDKTERDPMNGDLWIDSQMTENWDAAFDLSWGDESGIDWNALRSDKIKVYKNGQWVDVVDGTKLVDDADIEVDHNTAKMYARKLEQVNGELQQYYAELKVDAHSIRSQVDEIYNGLGSRITQTAREIRSDVYAANSQAYSFISQTASQIRSEVGNSISGVRSSITQTANQIRSEVNAANSQIYSSITQTASQIRSEVGNSVSDLRSRITQQADRISLVVEGTGNNAKIKPAQIVAAINDGASSVMIDANRIRLGVGDNSSVFSGLATGIQCNKTFTANKGLYVLNTAQTYAVDVRKLMHTATVSGNTLYIYDVDGNEVVNFSKPSDTPTIRSVWTSSYVPSGGQRLNSLKTQYKLAEDDGDYFCIQLTCNGKTKTYYCEP